MTRITWKMPITAAMAVSMAWAAGVGPISLGFVVPAEAVIGRPVTPVSYAGVARRTTRRTVAVTGAATAAAVAATPTTVVVTSPPPPAGCVKIVDSLGTVTYRCP